MHSTMVGSNDFRYDDILYVQDSFEHMIAPRVGLLFGFANTHSNTMIITSYNSKCTQAWLFHLV